MDFTKFKANYYFLDDKAYTEDDLLVYNIAAHQLPIRTTMDELFKYFEQFGDVLKVYIKDDGRSGGECALGVVHFAQPKAAAKALQRPNHQLRKRSFFVLACESWEQPEAFRGGVDMTARMAVASLAGDLIDFHTPIRSNILMLDDNCLETICRYLPLRDQIRFSRVCQRFRDIFKQICKRAHKVFHMNQLIGMTLWDIREFFEMAGGNIEELLGSVPYNYQHRIDFISNLSPNVRRVQLICNDIETTNMLHLLERMTALTELELCYFALNDNAVLALRKLPKLRTLMIHKCFELTGKNLNKLNQLTELGLFGCQNVSTDYFTDICKELRNLRILDIRHCNKLTAQAYDCMAQHCRELEQLKISCERGVPYEVVALLPKLRCLTVFSADTVREELFIALAAHKAQQLEKLVLIARNCISHEHAVYVSNLRQLKILFCPNNDNLNDECLFEFAERMEQLEEIYIRNCRAVTNVGLLVLLRRCAHLMAVNVEQCEGVTDDFVCDAYDVLKRGYRHNKEPVLFRVAGTNIHQIVVSNIKDLEISKLLNLKFSEENELG